MGKSSYAIATGSNRRHHRHGGPRDILAAAERALARAGLDIIASAPVRGTPPLGPAGRRFANGALLVRTKKDPAALLKLLKHVERDFGRRRGRRWGPRVLDLDIILWSEGIWAEDGLAVPHPGFRSRSFVLDPLCSIIPDWRDPLTHRSLRQLHARQHRRKPVDPKPPRA